MCREGDIFSSKWEAWALLCRDLSRSSNVHWKRALVDIKRNLVASDKNEEDYAPELALSYFRCCRLSGVCYGFVGFSSGPEGCLG